MLEHENTLVAILRDVDCKAFAHVYEFVSKPSLQKQVDSDIVMNISVNGFFTIDAHRTVRDTYGGGVVSEIHDHAYGMLNFTNVRVCWANLFGPFAYNKEVGFSFEKLC